MANPNKSYLRPTPRAIEEKRKDVRHGVLLQGKILFEGHTVYCAFHNLSSSGAKLQVGDVELPRHFELVMVGHQGRLAAELKWRNGEYAGVAFEQSLSGADVDALRPRRRLSPTGGR